MPPPLSQQGSRAGLITTVVIAVILLLVSAIMNFYQYSQVTQAEQDVQKVQRKYDKVVNREFSSESPEISNLDKVQKDLGDKTLLDTAIDETKRLATLIKGPTDASTVSSVVVEKDVKDLLAKTAQDLQPLGVSVATDTLQGAVSNLADAVKSRQSEIDKANNEVKAIGQKEQDEAKQYAAALADRDRQMEEANQKTATAVAAQQASETQKNAAVAQAGDESKGVVDTTNKALADKDVVITQLKADLVKAGQAIDGVRGQLAIWHNDVIDPIIRQADAKIIRVGANNDVYIDLGDGERVTPGLTFEVYDKNEGIPKLGKEGLSPDNMPEGKASIEVTNIGQNSSRCRIIKTAPGQAISEGDVCVNLVYDRHTKYNFMVYGDFDMNGDGIFTAGEAEMVKNLIHRWGGNVVNRISASTDFLILGVEPDVPQLSKDEEQDALLVAKRDAAKDALAKYNAVLYDAINLHIPVMNQNRFLYYTGYFDLLRR